MDIEELCKIQIQCFKCEYAYSCKYYQNPIWDWYMITNPKDGCPAMKYTFDSLYLSLLKLNKKEGNVNGNRKQK